MNETQRRIKAYKAALPGLRERVIAVALLLAMSVAMMTSATFAWLTISRAPEVSGVNTTVAANGNLEIALVGSKGGKPAESQVGDSAATKGQSITAANITWGNLINLSDPTYGLDNLTLRPAQLNTASLLNSPLYGALYGQDGRITQLSSNFGYTIWNMPEGNKPGHFAVSEDYGVRAISSTKIEAVGAEQQYVRMVEAANTDNLTAISLYTSLGSNEKYMPSLATMMGLYMTARMNPDHATLSNPDCSIADIQNLRDMYGAFLEAFDAEAKALASLINLQLFLKKGEGNYDPYDAKDIYSSTEASLTAEGLKITQLNQFNTDHKTILSDHQKLIDICQSGTSLKWKDSGLNGIVNNLVDVGKCTIGADNTPISSIGASNAMGYLSGTQEAKITNGILYRFEERTGGYIDVKSLGISATVNRMGMTIPATVKANIQTTAPRDYNLFNNDMIYSKGLNDGSYKGGVAVAEDTYGLAIDLWVRTNAPASYLVLEGNVLTEPEDVLVYGTDAQGNQVQLYTVNITVEAEDGTTSNFAVDVYPVEQDDKSIVWYRAENHAPMTAEELGDTEPTPKIETVHNVIGYEGDNRVWGDNSEMSVDATTQGSGSCYVYYADTPEDQARSLKLLEAFNVAFVDEEGKLIGEAIMDTERFYASNGRVIVPLMLDPGSCISLGENYEGEQTYALTALEQNVPTRITAIVYLDGTKLTNQEVLAAADIQGKLNIQFGSSEAMIPIDNEDLELSERRVSASIEGTSFDYDTATEPMTSTVTIHVDGEEPNTVTAFFLRAINSTQGSREAVMTFEKNAAGDWVATHTFRTPGNYVLRTVSLDGADYDLAEPQTVKITGFTVASLTCEQANENNYVNILTAENSSKVDLRLKFATDDAAKLPKTVAGRYLRQEDGSAVTVDFTYNSGTGEWTGSAVFQSSGTYVMQYLVLDGKYSELPGPVEDENGTMVSPGMWQTAHVTLGMRVAVYTTSPHKFKFVPSEMDDNMKLLAMQVMIMDNAGKEMPGLSDVKLTYGMVGSGLKQMDADLTWNGTYYVGELKSLEGGPGVWQFKNVVLGSNVLTNATTYPSFTIQSPEPPTYYGHSTTAYQFSPGNNAVMNVQITYSASAAAPDENSNSSVQAYIVNQKTGQGTWVYGKIGGEFTVDEKPVNNWSFKVPTDANGYQDGNWKITQIRIWDVYDANGNAYTETAPLVFDVANTNNVTKVVSRVMITFAEGQNKNFGKDASGKVTSAFMTSHTISGLNVDIKDFSNAPIVDEEGNSLISDVKLVFAYKNGSSEDYGGYTRSDLSNSTTGATVTIPLTADSTGTHFVQSDSATILYAGEYYTTFSYKISGTTYSFSNDPSSGDGAEALIANTPVFTVSSVKPYVRITAHTQTGTYATKVTYTNDWKGTPTHKTSDNQTSSHSDYAATLYAMAVADNSGGRHHGTYTQPTLTITVYGIADGYKASMTLPAGSANAVTFERTGNGAITMTLGKKTSANAGTGLAQWTGHTIETYYGHGTVSITTMTLTKDGVTYTVTLDNPLVITNPSS